MFAVKVKIYGVTYNHSSSIAFDKTSSYWSVSFVNTRLSGLHLSAFRNHAGSIFIEKDLNKPNYRIGHNYRIGPGCAGRA